MYVVSGMTNTIQSLLRGTGSYVPSRIVSNVDFLASLDTSDEWIRTRTGICERRYAANDETSASMAIHAAQAALQNAHLSAKDLDLIVCATVTPDLMTPSTANFIQHGIGCRSIPSFDIIAACTGFLYALSAGDQFIRAGTAQNVLVVGADVLTRAIDHQDRNTCILFGDGAGAVVLSAQPSPDRRGLHSVHLFSDASGAHLIRVPSRARYPRTDEKPVEFLTMNGREVYRFAVSRMIELIEQAKKDAEALGRKINLVIPHQVNQRIIDTAIESTGFSPDQVMINLDKYGNTSAASIPIALDEAMRGGRTKPGDTMLFVAFGGGLTWGSAMITL